jgi:ferredoxin-type protein NapF
MLSRRRFLSAQSSDAYRPPWAVDESDFIRDCTRCGDCIAVCEERIITKGPGGFPQVSFEDSGCTFCGKCLDACQTGALSSKQAGIESKQAGNENVKPWSLMAVIELSGCLVTQGVMCQSCRDFCDSSAIVFDYHQPIPVPEIKESLCTGCGFCIGACPTKAIKAVKAESLAGCQQQAKQVNHG